MKRHLEIKVGIFFLGALIILFIGVVSVRGLSLFKTSYIVKVQFDFAEGLTTASPVRFCGVDVGEVKKVEVRERGDRKPVVHVWAKVQNDVQIPRDSKFIINSLSLFGEKYLEILPPAAINGYLRKDEIVKGISGIPIANIFFSFNKAMKDLDSLVKEGKIKDSVDDILSNMREASGGLKTVIEDVQSGEGTVGKLLYDDSLYERLEKLIIDIQRHPWKLLHKEKKTRRKERTKTNLSF